MISCALAEQYDEIYVEAIQKDPVNGDIITRLEGFVYYDMFLVFDQQILSWSMAENVTLTLYGVKDGKTYYGQSYSASVESLALGMIQKNAATKPANCRPLVDMLNYGAAVQTAFKHNETLLPNTQLGEYAALGTSTTPSMTASSKETGTGSIKVGQVSISMQAKVELQILFMTKIDGYTPKATLNGAEVALTVDAETYGAYGWTIIKLAAGAANLRDYYEFALYDANGNAVSPVYKVSVEAYAKNQIGGTYEAVAVAMMRYGDSVAAYAKG
jgi:hypothetical protein